MDFGLHQKIWIFDDRHLYLGSANNIGTSNMTLDYFASTAGSSFDADHPPLVRTLQAVFDRDWASSYAWRLTDAAFSSRKP